MRHVIAFAVLAAAALLSSCTDEVGVTCPPGETLCGQTCVYTSQDPHNCGACGNDCGDLVCIGGTCGCPKGQTACNGECVNTTSDVGNCGACGTTCPMPQVCSMGMCSGSCAAGLTSCNRDCVDLTSDDKNCGTCGAACASGSHCQGGSCVQECPAGQVACNGKCASLTSDNSNCGACGNVCPDEYFCIFGSCILGCPQPLTRCVPDGGESDGGSQCIDTRFDPNNCGGCGGSDTSPAPTPSPEVRPHVCTNTDGFNDAPVCDNGRCSWTCAEGAIQCDEGPRGIGKRLVGGPQPQGGPQPNPNEPGIEQQCFLPASDNCNCGGCDINCGNDFGQPSRRGPLARAPQPRIQRGEYFLEPEDNGVLACFDENEGYPEPAQCCNSQCLEVGTDTACGNCAGVSDCTTLFPSPANGACCAKNPNINGDIPNYVQDNNCRDLNSDLHACGDCLTDCTMISTPPNPSGPPLPAPNFTACCFGSCTDFTQLNSCGADCNHVFDCTDADAQVPGCCPGPDPSSFPCVDFANDPNNCNTCGNKCAGTTPGCCPLPSPAIGGGCFDFDSDLHNCGSCGNDCSTNCPESMCSGGSCTPCPPPP